MAEHCAVGVCSSPAHCAEIGRCFSSPPGVAAVLELQGDDRDALESALAECRDAFPTPQSGSELEKLWAAAMGDPASVPAYVRAALALKDASTPAADWRAKGEPDPHGDRYACERAALAMGYLTDDELANGAFMNYDMRPTPHQILAGTHHSPIAWMTAVKDRIRWLSRRVVALETAAGVEHLVPVHPQDGADWDSLFRGTAPPWPVEGGYEWKRVVIFGAPDLHAIDAISVAKADAEEAALEGQTR